MTCFEIAAVKALRGGAVKPHAATNERGYEPGHPASIIDGRTATRVTKNSLESRPQPINSASADSTSDNRSEAPAETGLVPLPTDEE